MSADIPTASSHRKGYSVCGLLRAVAGNGLIARPRRASRHPHIYVLMAGFVLLALVAACGSDTEPDATATSPPTAAATSPPPPTATSPPALSATSPPSASPTSPPPQLQKAEPASVPSENDFDSDIKDFALEDITISVGTAVTWTNQDAAQHTSTSGEPDNETGIWGSGLLSKGGSFSFTFTEAGTFKYFCTVHPSIMKATVTVTDGASDAAPTATSEPTATLEPTATPVPPTATPEPTPGSEPAPSADELDSNIQNFTLQDITVSVGTTVTWTNRDSAPHTATSGEPGNQTGLWDSGRLSNGGSFSFTFTESGAFKYFCTVHGSSMTATVTVTDGESEAEPTPTPEPTATLEPAASTLEIFYARHLDLTISAGTSITWTNRDEVAHTVTAGDSPKSSGLFDSGNVNQGRTFDFKFSAAGIYTYFCAIHPAMEGTITVTEQ